MGEHSWKATTTNREFDNIKSYGSRVGWNWLKIVSSGEVRNQRHSNLPVLLPLSAVRLHVNVAVVRRGRLEVGDAELQT